MEEVLRTGNVPIAMPGKPGHLFGGGGGLVPPALLDESRLPRAFLEAAAVCGAASSTALPNTALVYKLMVTSSLPRAVLSHIWSAVNRSLPGQLTRPEFFSCLALIALAQRGESLAALSSMSQLPVPSLQGLSSSSPSSPSLPPSIPPPSQDGPPKSLFLPSALLFPSRKSKSKANAQEPAVDLVDLESEVGKEEEKSEETDGRMEEVVERVVGEVERVVEESMKGMEGRTSDVLREVCRTERGNNFVVGLGAAVTVAKRMVGNTRNEDMKRKAKRVEEKWKRLDEMRGGREEEDKGKETSCERCGICLQSGATVSFGGLQYHSECANLWVRHVEPLLPTNLLHN